MVLWKKQQSALSTGRTMPPTRVGGGFLRTGLELCTTGATNTLVSWEAAIDFDNKARLCVALLDQYYGCIPSEHLVLQIVVSESCSSPILFL